MEELQELNTADEAGAVALLTPLIERAPQIARRVARNRPFGSTDELAQTIRDELVRMDEAELIQLFCAHPELAPREPEAMTPESQAEQGRLALTTPNRANRERLAELNAQYRDKFGFPFITALVRHPSMASVMAEFEHRLQGERTEEIARAVEQIATVSAARVERTFGSNPTP